MVGSLLFGMCAQVGVLSTSEWSRYAVIYVWECEGTRE